MTETMSTSSTGGMKGVKPERHALLPRPGLDAIARVFGFGATKYADHNWRRGYEWSKSIDALLRHVHAFNDGETYDSESGLPHLGHAGFHVLVLLTWLAEQGEGGVFDDRYAPPTPEPPAVEDPMAPPFVHTAEETRKIYGMALRDSEGRRFENGNIVASSAKVVLDDIAAVRAYVEEQIELVETVEMFEIEHFVGSAHFSVDADGVVTELDERGRHAEPLSGTVEGSDFLGGFGRRERPFDRVPKRTQRGILR